MRSRVLTFWVALLVGLALVATACGGDDGTDGDDAADDGGDTADDTGTDGDGDDDDTSGDDGDDGDGFVEAEDQVTSEGEGGAADEMEPQSGGEVTFAFSNDGTGFDTTGAVAPGSIRIITALNDSLVGATAAGEWAPNLAESLVPNDDFTVWTINLRDGVTFHDGEPVDAAAVAANLQAFNDAPLTGFAFAPVDEIEAVSAMSVEVRMNQPWGAFPFILIGQAGWMVSPSTIGTNDSFTGTGPFMLESWTPNDGARVVRNPNYWREGLPYLDAVNFEFVPEQTVRRQALEAGDIDGYISPGDADILDFLDDDSIDVWIGEASANELLYLLNTDRPPFDDLRVRRALAHAVDPQVVIDNFQSGLTIPAKSFIHPGSPYYVETDYPEFDADEAARLIAQYEAEVGPVEFVVSTEPNPSFVEVTELVISFWEDAGAEVSIEEIGLGQSANNAIADNFDVHAWIQFSALDPDGDYPFLHSSGGLLNWTNYESAKIDEGFDIGRENADLETRAQGYAMVQEAFAEEVPIVWINHYNGLESAAALPTLHGIREGVLPDGRASIGMISGSFFSWEDVWTEQS